MAQTLAEWRGGRVESADAGVLLLPFGLQSRGSIADAAPAATITVMMTVVGAFEENAHARLTD